MMRATICLVIALVSALAANAQTNLMGKSEVQVVSAKGTPITKSVRGNQTTYRWSDVSVTFTNGKAIRIEVPPTPMASPRPVSEAEKRKVAVDAKKKHDQAINDKYMADSKAEHDAYVANEEKEKRDKEFAEQQEKGRADSERDLANQQTQHLQVRPKTLKEQEADNAAASKLYDSKGQLKKP